MTRHGSTTETALMTQLDDIGAPATAPVLCGHVPDTMSSQRATVILHRHLTCQIDTCARAAAALEFLGAMPRAELLVPQQVRGVAVGYLRAGVSTRRDQPGHEAHIRAIADELGYRLLPDILIDRADLGHIEKTLLERHDLAVDTVVIPSAAHLSPAQLDAVRGRYDVVTVWPEQRLERFR